MDVTVKQLKEALKLTEQCLQINSDDDVHEALIWLGSIIDCESALTLNVDMTNETPELSRNVAYHKNKNNHVCSSEDIESNVFFQETVSLLSQDQKNSIVCTPPCGGLGIISTTRNMRDNSATVMLVVSNSVQNVSSNNQILNYIVPHINTAFKRYAPSNKILLSKRELHVLEWISKGKSNWETATILGVSENTIKFHVSNICRKLDVRKRGHAIAKATQLGFLN